MNSFPDIKLTSFSHGAGCGCKLSPDVLTEVLSQITTSEQAFPRLLVGNASSDDAAVYDIGNNQAVISTTDFFMPIVDDAFNFGQIASANALSDVYAMGGKPIMAIAILGWPIQKLPAELAAEVLRGAEEICRQAGIPLAGGHSIDNPEPIFGLAVTGLIETKNLKKNNQAQPGDLIYITKPIGIGILATALKKGVISEVDLQEAVQIMTTLNLCGAHLGSLEYVHALTDVTGFGLLGHLKEICLGSEVSAIVYEKEVPVITSVRRYIQQGAIPGGTQRNWQSYGKYISALSEDQINLLSDPQTSGGLLICIDAAFKEAFEKEMKDIGQPIYQIGKIQTTRDDLIEVQV
ncbi:MAG: selenide, water dikinase SelD [Flavobacteriales bacterium]|nr:selenide, water dikinase SelD [Flavobacteriales bacterium]